MEHENFLIGFAQLSLVMTGFVTALFVFIMPEGGRSRVNTFHAVVVLVGSLICLLASLIPLLLSAYGLEGKTLWWWSSVAAFALGTVFTFIAGSLTVQLTRAEFKELGPVHIVTAYVLAAISMLLLGWNIFIDVQGGHYLTALVLTFFASLIGFVAFAVQKVFYW
ncbi:MAG: hypothetical protein R8J41_01030 [Alphaproteobacteria bacterium]|nr:hypothetical protein [Alphaproteobacteria bacterium]